MKLKLNLLLILISVLTLSNLNAQNDLLDSLTKASMEELDPSKEIMIDGITIPIFSVDGKQLSQEEMMQQFMKGNVAVSRANSECSEKSTGIIIFFIVWGGL